MRDLSRLFSTVRKKGRADSGGASVRTVEGMKLLRQTTRLHCVGTRICARKNPSTHVSFSPSSSLSAKEVLLSPKCLHTYRKRRERDSGAKEEEKRVARRVSGVTV